MGVVSSDALEDTSLAAHDGLAVAVCGRIDNLDDVAARWLTPGMGPISAAKVVLAAFRDSADHAPNLLRGTFSGVVTDGASMRAFRDHIGFGVLHYRQQGTDVYVATDGSMT